MKRRGLTLVELLVVIAIISVLAMLLVTASNSSMHFARQAVCVSNLRQLGINMTIYLNGNGGYYPLATPGGSISIWQHAISDSDGSHILYCPERIHPSDEFKANVPSTPSVINPHYGYNCIGSGYVGLSLHNLGLGGDPKLVGVTQQYTQLRQDNVTSPSQMLCIGDGDDFVPPEKTNTPPEQFLYFIFPFDVPKWGHIGVNDSHGGGANMLCCDIHVEYGLKTDWIAPNTSAMQRWNSDNQPHTNAWH